MGILYLIIVIVATSIGTGAGIGGGVIIKPLLDALGHYDVFVVDVLSTATILAMAVSATVRCLKNKSGFSVTLIFITIGATAGGVLGKIVFSLAYQSIESSLLITIQGTVTILLLVLVLFRKKLPKWNIDNRIIIMLIGLCLGTLMAFLGIGGGPVNVAVLCMFLGMDIKEAAAGSIFIILFAQATKLVTITLTSGFGGFEYSMLYFMIPGGILGGFLGSWMKGKIQEKYVEWVFYAVVVGVILLNLYNIVKLNM